MKKGDIVHLGNNIPDFIVNRASRARYNGYAKIENINGDVVTVLCLYGRDTTEGKAWIAHPVRYTVRVDKWIWIPV